MRTIEHIRGDIQSTGKSNRAEWSLLAGSILGVIVALCLALGLAQPARAAPGEPSTMDNAEKLRRLDIMLMVTSLRCRTTPENFIDDYGRFTKNHMSELNGANSELRTKLSAKYGKAGADRALDRISTVMANQYGGGHPWLGCGELRQVTKGLALVQGRDALVEAADQLLDRQPRPLLALGGH